MCSLGSNASLAQSVSWGLWRNVSLHYRGFNAAVPAVEWLSQENSRYVRALCAVALEPYNSSCLHNLYCILWLFPATVSHPPTFFPSACLMLSQGYFFSPLCHNCINAHTEEWQLWGMVTLAVTFSHFFVPWYVTELQMCYLHFFICLYVCVCVWVWILIVYSV